MRWLDRARSVIVLAGIAQASCASTQSAPPTHDPPFWGHGVKSPSGHWSAEIAPGGLAIDVRASKDDGTKGPSAWTFPLPVGEKSVQAVLFFVTENRLALVSPRMLGLYDLATGKVLAEMPQSREVIVACFAASKKRARVGCWFSHDRKPTIEV